MCDQAGHRIRRTIAGPVLMLGLVAGIVAAVVWANLWKSGLRVSDVRVGGNMIVSDKDILSLANVTRDQRLFSVDLQAAQKRILQNAYIKSASVNREAPDCISITVRERTPMAAVVLDKIEYVDADGVVLPPARSDNMFDLPVITGSFQQGDFVIGKQVGRADVREALAILASARRMDDGLYRRISEVHVEGDRDIMLYTSEFGVPVVFGRGDIAAKLAKLDCFWNEFVLRRGARELAYVDVRFEDQVVVRWHRGDEPSGGTSKPGNTTRKPAKS